jgi:radical SAM superfamily enzyme YgiQ (UPF0313 family)
MRHETIATYPLVTSRGCPYACSFCAVGSITSRKWRPRDPADCAEEVAAARKRFPGLAGLKIGDDCPTARPEHLKELLRKLAEQQPPLALHVDNMRADRVDDELIELMQAAGASTVCLGVEHGNAEVFALVNKGETLEDIRRAAGIIKRHGLGLGLCFVIGLPGDTLQRTGDSIRLAKELAPDGIFWNVAHPFPGTPMYEWFREHGTLDPPRKYTSYDTHTLRCPEPVASTPEFTKWERQRAYFRVAVETDQYALTRQALGDLARGAFRYRVFGPAVRSFMRRAPSAVARKAGRLLRRLAGRRDTA